MSRSGRPRRYVLRPASTAVTFWVGVVVLAIIAATPAATGSWRVFAFVLPLALFLIWLLWVVLYRPAVHWDKNEVVIVNIGRIHVLPWARVFALRQGINLIFTLHGGRTISAWGAPAPKGPGNLVSNFDRGSRLERNVDRNVEVLDGYLLSAAPSEEQVTSRWDVVPLAIGGVLLLAVVVDLAFGLS